ncbi:MAG: SDR family oxidoreductase [Alphaproteobacteria bacterium]
MNSASIFAPGLFAGCKVLVTGGGTGIGFAIASEFGGLGASVVIAGRTVETLEKAAGILASRGIAASALPLNIRKEGEVAGLFDQLERLALFPDILVNNAGGQFARQALDISANGFRAVVDLNLNGTWHMCQAFATRAVARGSGGTIINIVLSAESGSPGFAHSAAARAGVINLTKTLAIEWARHGIRVNAVAPGTIETAALEQYHKANTRAAIARLPVKRIGRPLEVAWAVAFLASRGGEYITGATLFVDGGKHLAGSVGIADDPTLAEEEPQ